MACHRMTDASRGIDNYQIKLEKIPSKLGTYFDSCYFGRPYFGRLLDLCLSGSRLVGVVFVGVNRKCLLVSKGQGHIKL